MMQRFDFTLHVLVDPAQVPTGDVLPFCEAIQRGGATVVQLRGKTSTGHELFQSAQAFRQATRLVGLTFIVNDRLDVALAADADGVHVGQDDLPVAAVRRLAPTLAIGLSVGSFKELATARLARPDYLGIGPVYPTQSKPDAGAALGVDGFRALARAANTVAPVVAIGGIQMDTADAVWRAGANGLAVISAVMSATDRTDACRRLLPPRH